MPQVLAAPDKFKGTATATAVAGAVGSAAAACGWEAIELPMSDGGEGLLDVVGGPNRSTVVTGPLASPVTAAWRLQAAPPGDDGRLTAWIEMSQAAGLVLAGGPGENDAVAATTAGVGELILAAADSGARRVVVGCGGSATTDGGAGALEAIGSRDRLAGIELVVACDVTARFVEAAARFAPQKGASLEQVRLLTARLGALADRYAADFGADVRLLDGSGAAGGLAGGLAAVGGRLVSGFALVADVRHLDDRLGEADAVVTGEGCLDGESFAGKVVGSVSAQAAGLPRLCVCGSLTAAGSQAASERGLEVVSLSERFGRLAAIDRPVELVARVVEAWLRALGRSSSASQS